MGWVVVGRSAVRFRRLERGLWFGRLTASEWVDGPARGGRNEAEEWQEGQEGGEEEREAGEEHCGDRLQDLLR